MIEDPGRINQADDPDQQSLPKTKARWHQTIMRLGRSPLDAGAS